LIEDKSLKDMSQATQKGIRFAKTAKRFIKYLKFLQYKLEEQGKKLIKIDKWFPSSKTCSCCGQVRESLSLSERTFRCECGFESDRDVNAAINIKHEGMKRLAIA
jgi:putative transposase